MIQQVIINKNDYDEIEKKIAEYNEMKKIIGDFIQVKKVLVDYDTIKIQLNELQHTNEKFEKFKETVAEMFLNDKGNFSYRERPIASNELYLNSEIVAYLFNYLHEENFYKDTRLKVNEYWDFEGRLF